MSIMALEGLVEDGHIRLKTKLRLPNKTKVYVLVPDIQTEEHGRIFSPHLVNSDQAIDFEMEVIEGHPNASV